MTYYKIISQEQVIGVGTMFLQWNSKRKRFYYSDIDDANCIQDAITQKIYYTSWLRPLPSEVTDIETVTVIIIEANEYNDLYEQLKEDETIPFVPPTPPEPTPEPTPEPVPVETPMTIQQMRDKITEQGQMIDMLTECLLEVSELIYEE